MKLRWAILIAIGVFAALAAAVYLAPGHGTERPHGFGSKVEWQRMANPGALSQAHAFLDHNCNVSPPPFMQTSAVAASVTASTRAARRRSRGWTTTRWRRLA